jgi:hypothetical protein
MWINTPFGKYYKILKKFGISAIGLAGDLGFYKKSKKQTKRLIFSVDL